MEYSPFNATAWLAFFGFCAVAWLAVKVFHARYPEYPGYRKEKDKANSHPSTVVDGHESIPVGE